VRQATQFTKRFLTVRMSRAVRYKHECNFIYAQEKCKVLLGSFYFYETRLICAFVSLTRISRKSENKCGNYG
jgi:hypothetical protein